MCGIEILSGFAIGTRMTCSQGRRTGLLEDGAIDSFIGIEVNLSVLHPMGHDGPHIITATALPQR